MPFSRIVTSLRVDLAGFRKDLDEAKKLAAQQTRLIEQAMRVRPGIGGGAGAAAGGRSFAAGGGGGGRSASQELREQVRDQLASFAQIRKFRKELSDQEDRELRARSAKNRQSNQSEQREREQRRAKELQALRADIQTRAREETRAEQKRAREEAQTFSQRARQAALGNQQEIRAQQQRREAELRALRNDIQSRARDEAQLGQQRARQAQQNNQQELRAREQRRAAELRALRADITSRAQSEAQETAKLDQIRRQSEAKRRQEAKAAAQEAARAEGFLTGGAQQGVRNFQFEQRERARRQREADAEARRIAAEQSRANAARIHQDRQSHLFSAAAGRSVRIDRPGGGFGFGGGGGGIPRGGDIDAVTAKIRGGLTTALQRASNAAQQLNLLVGVSIFGGMGALVAEGFRLNSQIEKVNLTMAATLGITNDVVDATGKRVSGEQKAQFLLKGTADIYNQVRKIAAESILEQQELLETVGENLALGQRAGFRLQTLGQEETGPLVKAIADISQLAKAVGLPGGQRQLSQEVRALFTGERLQGATIARLLGFNEISEIQKLQSQPGKQEGTTAFVDELTKRFERARPIIEKFQDSAQGVFSTLISQGRLFLQIFSESAFNAVTGVGKELRNFLTDQRVRDSAKELGESFGTLVRNIIDVGRYLSPFASLLGFMVRNAGTLTGLLIAFKSLQFLQNLRGIGGIGGGGGVAGFLGGALGTRAAGGFGGGRGGFGSGVVGPGRQAAIGFAAAASEFGVRGALARQGGLARGVLGSSLGRGGIGAFAPAIGLLGATPATALVLAGLTGLGIGVGANALGNRFVRGGIQPAPEQVNAERAGAVRPLIALRNLQESARERARQLERRGRVGLQAPGEDRSFFEKVAAAGPSSLLDIVNPFKFGRQLAREFTPTPVLTERVRAEDLRKRADQRDEERAKKTKEISEDKKLQLQRTVDANAQQKIENALFLAQIRRNKEAEINLTAQLDKIKAVSEINDAHDRNARVLAIEEDRVKKLRELRQDELQDTEEAGEAALGNEEKVARLRARRRFTDIERQFQGRELTPELITLRERQRATADLNAQKEILGARVNRFSQRAGFAGQLAGVEGRSLDQIRAGAFSDIAGAAQQRVEGRISNREFDRFVEARQVRAQEEIRKKRREVINEGISLTNQFTDTVIRATDLARDHWLGLLQLRERISDRERALNKARKDEQRAIVQALREEKEAREDLRNFLATKGQQGAVRDILRAQTAVQGEGFGTVLPSGEERIRRQIRDRFGRTEEGRQLTGEQRTEAVDQQTQTFVRGIADALVSPEGLGGVAAKLQEIGLKLTDVFSRGQIGQLQTIAGEGGVTREVVRRQGETREEFAARQRVEEAGRGVGEAREQRARTEVEDVRARRDERIQAIQIEQDFNRGKAQLAQDFSNLAVTSREFLIEAQRASIGLGGLTAALVAATGVKVPSPEALAVQNARQAVASDQKAAGTTTVRPALPTSTGGVTREGTAKDGRRSDAGTIINIDLGGLKIGTDTEETFKKLGVQLERDARRTPVS